MINSNCNPMVLYQYHCENFSLASLSIFLSIIKYFYLIVTFINFKVNTIIRNQSQQTIINFSFPFPIINTFLHYF